MTNFSDAYKTTKGPFHGAELPKLTGFGRLPPGYGPLTNGYNGGTCGAVIMTFIPLVISDLTPIVSLSCYNTTAGDSGKKARFCIAKNDGSFTVEKDFGEITYAGAAGLNTATPGTPWTPSATGLFWLTFHTKEASTILCMAPHLSVTAVGGSVGLNMFNVLGEATPGTNQSSQPFCHYKSIAYATPGSTLTAPDTTYYGASSLFAKDTVGMGGVPAIWIKN